MGGFVAWNLGSRCPELLESAMVTGAAPFQGGAKWIAQHPSLIWFMLSLLFKWVPTWLFKRITGSQGMETDPELLNEMRLNLKWENLTRVFDSVLDIGFDDVKEVKVRTLAMAGGKGDDVDATRMMGELLKGAVDGSRAVVIRNGTHSWHLRYSELFAQSVLAWIERTELPAALEPL
jgi:pimeloyl-ACP methyl ester carboxylesterase